MGQQSSNSDTLQVRLDKWLWAARFYKTRSIARNMIDGGKVHYNGQRSKPSKLVEVGAEVRLRQGSDEKKPLSSTNCPAPDGEHPKHKRFTRKPQKVSSCVKTMPKCASSMPSTARVLTSVLIKSSDAI